MKDCPSQHTYIVIEDGGYVSASDVEDEYALAANHADNKDGRETNINHKEVFNAAAIEDYRPLIVHRVLSTKMEQAEQLQRHNLFQMFLIVKDYRVRVIIDEGSCNNF